MPEQLSEELKAMKEREFRAFIHQTVEQLHTLADRLEHYAKATELPDVGFDTTVLPLGDEEESSETPDG